MAKTRRENTLHCLPFHSQGTRVVLLLVLIALAVAFEVSSAFRRAWRLAGSSLSSCLGSAVAPGGCGAEPLGQGELPAPSSGNELLRTRKGRPGDDTTLLHELPARRLFLRFKTIPGSSQPGWLCLSTGQPTPCPGREDAAGKQTAAAPAQPLASKVWTTLHTSSPGSCHLPLPAGSPCAQRDCEHPAAPGPPQLPVPAWPHSSARGTAPAAPLSISQSPSRRGQNHLYVKFRLLVNSPEEHKSY